MRPAPRLILLAVIAAILTAMLAIGGDADASILVWAVLAAAAALDLALTRSARGVRVEAEAPPRVFVGEDAALRLLVSGPSLPGWIDLRVETGEDLSAETPAPLRPQGPEAGAEVAIRAAARGALRVQAAHLRWASRFGLFEITPRRALDLAVEAIPNIRPVLNGQIETQLLPLTDGRKDMRLRGEGSEFHQLRDFLPGMDPRSIDWKRSARGQALVARETRAERNHQVILCIDAGRLMGERLGGLSKLDHALNAALALAWAAGLSGDSVGFYVFDSRPRHYEPPRSGTAAFARILDLSAGLALDAAETNHAFGLSHLNAVLKRRSLVAIFSDFADPVSAELLVEHSAAFSRRHLAMFVTLQDPGLAATAAASGRADMAGVSRAVAARQMLTERRLVFERMARIGVSPLETPPGALTPALLSRYIEIKSRELL
ncbi:DUF58 domain-containing protein [Rhodovulum sp. DZ06]|uniref:DUF58 domain-containing protein n=1 Tax=Rhodovulum sp. DZ06 TaxID=3425126 RepID=UPI003D358BE9